MLSFNDIKKAKDYRLETHSIVEWGGDVHLRSLTSDDKDRYELAMLDLSETKAGRIRALLVGLCLCDADGKRIVADNELDELGKKSATVLDTLYQRCRVINGLNGEVYEEAKKN